MAANSHKVVSATASITSQRHRRISAPGVENTHLQSRPQDQAGPLLEAAEQISRNAAVMAASIP